MDTDFQQPPPPLSTRMNERSSGTGSVSSIDPECLSGDFEFKSNMETVPYKVNAHCPWLCKESGYQNILEIIAHPAIFQRFSQSRCFSCTNHPLEIDVDSNMKNLICFAILPLIWTLFMFVALVKTQSVSLPYEILFSWKAIDYKFPNLTIRDRLLRSGEFKPENNVIAGIKIFGNKIFLTVPRMRDGVPSTLNYVEFNRNEAASVQPSNSPLIPYPSWEFQKVGNCSALQFIMSMEIDQFGRMWVIDVGRVNTMTDNPDNRCPPKLLLIDLNTDKVVKVHQFPSNVVSQTSNFLNDIVVGCKNKDNCWAYITDAADSKLVIYNLKEDRSFFVTHETMEPDPNAIVIPMLEGNYTFNSSINGIALSPIDLQFDRLYYRPLASFRLFSVATSVLQNAMNGKRLADSQVTPFERSFGHSGGLAMDAVGNMYYGLYSNNSVAHFNTRNEQETVLIRNDEAFQWPDTFSFDNEGYLYVTTNKMQRFITNTYDLSQQNFRVVRVYVGHQSYMYSSSTRRKNLQRFGWSNRMNLKKYT
ncbi:unnamed protein product [Orchesella dallaii]|uniref:Protein yellow n=1 Tax=Orchesella dallaii TaxID=48710 RepID=A0ABP1SAK8_9HEXA